MSNRRAIDIRVAYYYYIRSSYACVSDINKVPVSASTIEPAKMRSSNSSSSYFSNGKR